MNQHVSSTLGQLIFGAPIQHLNLIAIPIFLPQNLEWGAYITLKEGLDKELVLITEVSEGGSVPNLMVTNNADLPLLLLDGEELIGAKQNRIVNTSLLLPAHSKTMIPVSCTERGRWNYNSKHFGDSGVIMSSKARYNKSERVKNNLERGAGYDARQGEVWNDIETYHNAFNSSSKSHALRDVFSEQQGNIDQFLQKFPIQPGQCGLAVFLNGRFAGLDFVSSPQAYSTLHKKLISSYTIEALIDIRQGKERIMSDPGEAVFVLRGFNNHLIETATETEFKPVGLGIDYRYTAQRGTASALVLDNKVVHFSAFSDSTKEEPVKHSSDLVKDETDISVIISKRFRKILNDKLNRI
jgi:hypothetical protein